MKTVYEYLSIVTTLILLFALSSCSDNVSPLPTQNEKMGKEIDRLCDSIISHTKCPGIIVGAWSEELGFSYEKGFGYANIAEKEPSSPDKTFHIGSVTKTFVNTILLQLVDEGKLSLDDKLAEFESLPYVRNAEHITVRMLSNMTSGIFNYYDADQFQAIYTTNPMYEWSPFELVQIAGIHENYFQPGEGLQYSNTNTILIGMIIEAVTGKTLIENIQSRIIDKYALKNTYFPVGNFVPANITRGYANYTYPEKYIDDITDKFDCSWGWAAGAMISDIRDLKKWAKLLVHGGMISDTLQSQRFETSFPIKYGLGMFTWGSDMWGHNGGMDGYTTAMYHHKTKNFCIVISFNFDGEIWPDALFFRIAKILYPDMVFM